MHNSIIPISNVNISTHRGPSFELLLASEYNLGVSAIETLDEIEESVVVGCLLGSITVGSYFKTALYHYLYDNRKDLKNRPIDLLLLVQAIIQHLICLLMVLTFTVGLLLNITFSHHIDESWCNVPFYGGTFGAGYRNIGGLGMAVFRLLFLFHGNWVNDVFGINKLFCVILAASLTLSGLMTLGFGVGNGPSSRKRVTWNFCIGQSVEFREVLHEYSVLRGTVIPQDYQIPELVVLVSLASVVAELGCYIGFFGHIYRHNEDMMKKKRIRIEDGKRRHQKNAVTFFGQFWTFVVECLVYICLMYSMRKTSHIAYRLAVIFGFWIEFGVVSVVEVMTSQSLRPYLPHNRLFR